MAIILITGGTGLTGRALSRKLLSLGHEVIILSRSPSQSADSNSRLSYAYWNVEEQQIDSKAVARADYIIHLAGASVIEKRWTLKRKKQIVDSRVKGVELLVKALSDGNNKVKALISASAIGWYGAGAASQSFTETDPAANDFLGQTCRQWEESLAAASTLDKRVVKFRIGIVLSSEGGALREFIKPLRFGIAAILGNGQQVVSWIHIDDLVNLYIMAIENEALNGTYNAVAPFPVSNKELTLELARQRNKKWFIPIHVPAFMLKLILGKRSIEILKSASVSSEKIEQAGYDFLYPSLDSALRELLAKPVSP